MRVLRYISIVLLLSAASFSLSAQIPDSLVLADHPRLLMDSTAFENMKQKVQVDSLSASALIHRMIMDVADETLSSTDEIEYKLDESGRRLLQQSRKALKRIFANAYAYRYTEDSRYLECAEKDLRKVCSFKSWNPSHFLDVAEMATAVGIGYDWLYDGLSEGTRSAVVKSLVNNAFNAALNENQAWYAQSVNNWNQVCNGGLVTAALAVWERCDTTARRVVEDALTSNRMAMDELYAPDGNYGEGPDYWNYGTLYEALMISSLYSVFGTDFGLSDSAGFDRTADYIVHCSGTAGKLFNYYDNPGDDGPFYPLWFFADRFHNPSLLYNELKKLQQGNYAYTENLRLLPLLSLYASRVDTDNLMAPEKLGFAGHGVTPVVMVRTGWEENAMYMGVLGGSASNNHAHKDAGSFVFDAYGVRWAVDLERQSYQSVEKAIKKLGGDFWDLSDSSLRWALFRMNNRQHNTLTVNDKDHFSKGRAHLLDYVCTDAEKGGLIDLTSVFGGDLDTALRRVSIKWNDWLEVRDSIAAPSDTGATVRWSMVTRADVSLCDDGILLSQDGITMKLQARPSERIQYKIWSGDPQDYDSPLNICNAPNPGVSIIGFVTELAAGESMEIITTLRRAETVQELAARVFGLAESQLKLLASHLDSSSLPRYATSTGKLVTSDIGWWCSGFFPGSLWLAYEQTSDAELRRLAELNSFKLDTLIKRDTDHDIGFQMMSSYGQAYRVTGERKWLGRLFEASEKLARRFNPKVSVIKSWNFTRNGWQYPVIIDNMMNLELLTFASRQFRNQDLNDIAVTHARTTMHNHFRPDFTSWHLVDYDTRTGSARSHETVQGFADYSAWARGQAWALYGYTMMFRETGLEEFLSQAEGIASMLLTRLPYDGVPYWDFDDDKIPYTLKDASAAAIMASAFVELSSLSRNLELKKACLSMAELQLQTLSTPEYLAGSGEYCGFMLKHSVGNLPADSEVDVALTYADYYYLEALSRLLKQQFTGE